MFLRHAYVAASIAFLCATPFISAAAQPQSESRTVNLADLDISSLAGQAEMQRRVRQAADAICASQVDRQDLKSIELRDQCRTKAIASAAPWMRNAIARAEAQRDQMANISPR